LENLVLCSEGYTTDAQQNEKGIKVKEEVCFKSFERVSFHVDSGKVKEFFEPLQIYKVLAKKEVKVLVLFLFFLSI
jgi:hypothetical protein